MNTGTVFFIVMASGSAVLTGFFYKSGYVKAVSGVKNEGSIRNTFNHCLVTFVIYFLNAVGYFLSNDELSGAAVRISTTAILLSVDMIPLIYLKNLKYSALSSKHIVWSGYAVLVLTFLFSAAGHSSLNHIMSFILDWFFIAYSLNLFCATFMIHLRLSCRFGREDMSECLLQTSFIMLLLFITVLLFFICRFRDVPGEWTLFVGSSVAFMITVIHSGEVLRGYPIINWLVSRCRRKLSKTDPVGLKVDLLMASDLLAHRLTDYFEKEKPFLSPELCIHQVAMFLMTNKTTLSRVIHSKMNTNFREYVNRYRIREAMYLFSKNMHLDMEELAKLSGFRNNTSFTNAFKVNTGMTPGVWCKEQKEKKNEIWKKENMGGIEKSAISE